MSTIQTRIEWFGRLRVDQPVKPRPVHEVHELESVPGIHTCTRCGWAVFTYSDNVHPAITDDYVRRAFAKHLLTTALAEP